MSVRRSWWGALAWAVATCSCAIVVYRALAPDQPVPMPYVMSGAWIAGKDPSAQVSQFRKTFFLSSNVRQAWLAVSAVQGFEVIVNGATVAQSLLWRPTRPFQTGLSEVGQRIGPVEPMLDLIFPREYQWTGHRTYRIPAFVDIAPFLSPGKNVVCVEVETREPPASLALEGEVVLWSQDRVSLRSDSTYKTAPAPPSYRWTEPEFADDDWPASVVVDAPPGDTLRMVEPGVYRRPFEGKRLQSTQTLPGAAWFSTTWHLAEAPHEAWLRILSNRPFELFVNESPVHAPQGQPGERDTGDWIVGTRTSVDAPSVAEPLDPDQVGAFFSGSRLERPADGAWQQPDDVGRVTLGSPASASTSDLLRNRARPTAAQPLVPEVPLQGGPLLRGSTLDAAGKVAPAPPGATPAPPLDPVAGAPEAVGPVALRREQVRESLYAYGVTKLLHRGDNQVAVRVSPPETPDPSDWPLRLAVDGQATTKEGMETPLEGSAWSARAQTPDGSLDEATPVASVAPAVGPGAVIPRLEYRGEAELPASRRVGYAAASLVLAAVFVAFFARLPRWIRGRSSAGGRGSADFAAGVDGGEALAVLLLPTALFVALSLVSWSWTERDEALSLLPAAPWCVALALGSAAAGWSAWALARDRAPSRSMAQFLGAAPSTRWWPMALALTVALAAVLRAHAMDAQPLDDDELASTQAVLAITQTGIPRFTPDVIYTRGPLYHYLTAALVEALGHNIWALRLPSVLFGAATVYLIYLVGAELLASAWVGLVAALFFAVHPYAIFVGHLVRFYQQQTFFALATVYFFVRGFVRNEGGLARYLALGSFTLACLSQELSVVLAPALLLLYGLFGKEKGYRSALAFAFVAGCAALLVFSNIAVFQTRCLTKLEGISPNVEATLALHFSSPTNFLSLFVSYSRLHLALSLLLAASLLPLLRRPEPEPIALLIVLSVGVFASNVLVTGQSLRYQYWLVPVWILLGVHGVRLLARCAADVLQGSAPSALVRHWLAPIAAGLGLLAVVLSWSPWRIPGSYDTKLLGDSAAAFRYVKSQLREGDRVAATEPHAHAGKVEIGRIDYDLAVPLLHDFVYRKEGRLVDRNGGAEVLFSLEQLEDAMAAHDRIWILVNREKFRSRGNDVRWDFPGARVEDFLRRTCEVKFKSYLWTVFLWDTHAGRFHSLPPAQTVSWASPE